MRQPPRRPFPRTMPHLALCAGLLAAACGKGTRAANEVEASSTGGTATARDGTTGTATGSTDVPVNPSTGIVQAGSSEGDGPGSLEPHPQTCSQVCSGNVVPINNNAVTAQYCPAGNAPVGSAVPCEGFCYVAETVQPQWFHEPPCSGPVYPHYDYQWGEHTAPLSRGAYVHNLAHGFIVIAYNCPNGCADQLTALRGVLTEAAGARVILTPDPLLQGSQFAAMAWTWSYTFASVDPAALSCFIAQHNTQGWPH